MGIAFKSFLKSGNNYKYFDSNQIVINSNRFYLLLCITMKKIKYKLRKHAVLFS